MRVTFSSPNRLIRSAQSDINLLLPMKVEHFRSVTIRSRNARVQFSCFLIRYGHQSSEMSGLTESKPQTNCAILNLNSARQTIIFSKVGSTMIYYSNSCLTNVGITYSIPVSLVREQ